MRSGAGAGAGVGAGAGAEITKSTLVISKGPLFWIQYIPCSTSISFGCSELSGDGGINSWTKC